MLKTIVNLFLKTANVAVIALVFNFSGKAQNIPCPNFEAGHDSLNKVIQAYWPLDSAKDSGSLYFQYGWAANKLQLYANIIVDNIDIMPYGFYKNVTNKFVYTSHEQLLYFYMKYEYPSGKSQCFIRNYPLNNPPEKKREVLIKPQDLQFKFEGKGKGVGSGDEGMGSAGKPERYRELQISQPYDEPEEPLIMAPPPVAVERDASQVVFESSSVDEAAQYRGGESALIQFLSSNIRYPKIATENNIEGTVFVQFTISKYGGISDVKILGNKKIGFGLEEEAMRVIRMTSGSWTSAKLKGNPVNMRMNLPIKFQLD